MSTSATTSLPNVRDRGRCTGEPFQYLAEQAAAGADTASIPDADPDLQSLEADIYLEVCKIGGRSPHPNGIREVRPEPDRLRIQLLSEPYVIRHWAEHLLPTLVGDPGDHPADQVQGVPGLRHRIDRQGIHLHRPGRPGVVLLQGFNPTWWQRAAAAAVRGSVMLATEPNWTPVEQAAETERHDDDPHRLLASALLRRIRATAGAGMLNGTDAWPGTDALRVETTDGPRCSELVRLLAGPASPGWRLEQERCRCSQGANRDGCSLVFLAPGDGQVAYTNLRWGRTVSQTDFRRIAESNARAFS